MKRTFVLQTGSRGRARGQSPRFAASRYVAVAVALAFAASLALSAPAVAQPAPCTGPYVVSLGGPHAITGVPIDDVADLRRRLPDLEASIRTVVTNDPSLGPVVADALIAAIRNGAGITERPMRRDEPVHWMAYQPRPGQIEAISPACLRLKRTYDSFEITVEIPDSTTAVAPTCAISAMRDCAPSSPAITLDLRGTSPGARVTMAANGRPPVAVSGEGTSWKLDDPDAYNLDATFTVRVEGAPAPARTARVFRFLMPKICGNLAYLGEAPSRTLAPAGAPLTCEKSVRVGRCAQIAAPPPILEPEPVADLCEAGWVARGFLFAWSPTGDEQRRDITLPTGPAREKFSLDGGYGLGLSVEKRYGPVFGLEGAVLFGKGDSDYEINNGFAKEADSHETTFYAFTVGPNFHLLGCDGADFYIGPFVGYGGLADPNYWAFDHHFAATFDGEFIWGAQAGLAIPFSSDGPWSLHAGLRYLDLSQETDAGTIKVDPWIVSLGLSYRF
jgi:hypothetical protein